jgi:hypothetical protein
MDTPNTPKGERSRGTLRLPDELKDQLSLLAAEQQMRGARLRIPARERLSENGIIVELVRAYFESREQLAGDVDPEVVFGKTFAALYDKLEHGIERGGQ